MPPKRKFDRFKRKDRTRVNFQIRLPEVRVIDDEGEQLGVMSAEAAIKMAQERDLDLVEVSPTARPPVCLITDYGRFKYEKSKREKISKKKQHTVQLKEIKLRPKIEEHDFNFKKRHAEEFLGKFHKVKFTVIFRGRELDHKELGRRLLHRMIEDLKHIGTVERQPMFEGRLMTMFMAPIGKPPTTKSKPERSAPDADKGKEKVDAKDKDTEKKKEPVEAPAEAAAEADTTEKEGNDAEA